MDTWLFVHSLLVLIFFPNNEPHCRRAFLSFFVGVSLFFNFHCDRGLKLLVICGGGASLVVGGLIQHVYGTRIKPMGPHHDFEILDADCMQTGDDPSLRPQTGIPLKIL